MSAVSKTTPVEWIVCAAIYVDDGVTRPSLSNPISGLVISGRRHFDCFLVLNELGERMTPNERLACNMRDLERMDGPIKSSSPMPEQLAAMERSLRGFDQGFVTSTGRYVGREEAARIALAAGQVARRVQALTSEDLY